MAATVRGDWYGGNASEPAGSTAETGIGFSLDDAKVGTTPIQIPTATGTAFSWVKLLALNVTATGSTNISNRKVSWATSPTTGLAGFFAQQATYRQPASGNKPSDSGSNGATPSPAGASAPGSYTGLTTTPQTFDSGSDSTGSTGRSGDFVELVAAVSNNYAGGAGSAIALPNLTLTYDEA